LTHPPAPPVAQREPNAAPDTHLKRPSRPGPGLGLDPEHNNDKSLGIWSSRHSNTAAPVHPWPTPLSWFEKKVPEHLAPPTEGIPSEPRAELRRDAHARRGTQGAIDPTDPGRWIGRCQGRVDADFLDALGLGHRGVRGEEKPDGGPIPEPCGRQSRYPAQESGRRSSISPARERWHALPSMRPTRRRQCGTPR